MKYYAIYLIICNKPGVLESYIGRTNDTVKRFRNHRTNCIKHSDKKLYNKMNEHGGLEFFNFIILESCETIDNQLAKEREKYFYSLFQPTLNTNIPNRTCNEWRKDNRMRYNKYVNEFIRRKNLYLKELRFFNTL